MKIKTLAAALAFAGCAVTTSAQAAYFEADFNAGTPAGFSGGSLFSVQGFNGLGNSGNTFSGAYLRSNGTITLTLAGLPTHTGFNLGFLLAVLDSWDGPVGFNCCSPDILNVVVDGKQVFSSTFNIFGHAGTDYNAPAQGLISQGSNLAAYPGWVDQGYDMSLDTAFQNIAHTASTLSISWQQLNSQGFDDESFAIDNVRINLVGTAQANAVPEPASLALAGLGLAGLGFTRRRKAAKAS